MGPIEKEIYQKINSLSMLISQSSASDLYVEALERIIENATYLIKNQVEISCYKPAQDKGNNKVLELKGILNQLNQDIFLVNLKFLPNQ